MGEIVAHPRLLEHQDERRRRRRHIATFVAVLVVVLGAAYVIQSPLVGVRHLRIHGADRTGAQAVAEASGLGPRSAIVRLDAGRVGRRVASLPWVQSARVVRHWPSTVEITVIERTPAALVACIATESRASGSAADAGPGATAGECPVLVDRTGRVLAPATELTERGDLPLIEGLPSAGAPGTALPRDADGALAVAASLPPSLRPLIASIVAGTGGEVTMRLRPHGRGTVLLGLPDRVPDKLTAAATVLAHLNADPKREAGAIGTPAVLDVRVPEAPALTGRLDR